MGAGAYVAGDAYSIADIACLPYALGTAMSLGIDTEEEMPALHAWVQRLLERPAVRCAGLGMAGCGSGGVCHDGACRLAGSSSVVSACRAAAAGGQPECCARPAPPRPAARG